MVRSDNFSFEIATKNYKQSQCILFPYICKHYMWNSLYVNHSPPPGKHVVVDKPRALEQNISALILALPFIKMCDT